MKKFICPRCQGTGSEWPPMMTTAPSMSKPKICILCLGKGKIDEDELERRLPAVLEKPLSDVSDSITRVSIALEEIRRHLYESRGK